MVKDIRFNKISSFWEWFETQERRIREILDDELHPDREELVQMMDNQVLNLGLFTWEMGPEGPSSFYLTISPNGDPELLQLSKSIVKASPALSAWTFYYAKPIKEEPIELKLYDEEYNLHFVNAQSWQFGLSLTSSGHVDITIVANNMRHLDQETRIGAGNLVISSLLGEECHILHVRHIHVTTKAHSKDRQTVPAKAFKQAFDKLLQGH